MRHGQESHRKGFEGYKAAVVAEGEQGATYVRGANVADGAGASESIEQAAACAARPIG